MQQKKECKTSHLHLLYWILIEINLPKLWKYMGQLSYTTRTNPTKAGNILMWERKKVSARGTNKFNLQHQKKTSFATIFFMYFSMFTIKSPKDCLRHVDTLINSKALFFFFLDKHRN